MQRCCLISTPIQFNYTALHPCNLIAHTSCGAHLAICITDRHHVDKIPESGPVPPVVPNNYLFVAP